MAKNPEINDTAGHQLAEDGELLQGLHFIIVAVIEESRKWRKLATETAKKLRVAKADVVLRSGLRKTAREVMDAKVEVKTELRELLEAKSGKLAWLSASNGELTDELSCVKPQHAPGATMSDALKWLVVACERPAKRAQMT